MSEIGGNPEEVLEGYTAGYLKMLDQAFLDDAGKDTGGRERALRSG